MSNLVELDIDSKDDSCNSARNIKIGVDDFGSLYYSCFSSSYCYELLYNQCIDNKDAKNLLTVSSYECGILSCSDLKDFTYYSVPQDRPHSFYSKVLVIPLLGSLIDNILNKVGCPEGMKATYISPTEVYCDCPEGTIAKYSPKICCEPIGDYLAIGME